MRDRAPFGPDDLRELDERLLRQAVFVKSMRDIRATDARQIGLRHDVDNEIDSSVAMAAWEAERGYQSTYYVLHTAPYWADKPSLRRAVDAIAGHGHEIGFHLDAIGAALEHGGDPVEILKRDLEELRSFGHPVTGVVAHGNGICHRVPGGFVNDEIFIESAREQFGDPDRTLVWGANEVRLNPIHRHELGIVYDPNWLLRAGELSDSGGKWHTPFDGVVAAFQYLPGPLHILHHCCWWKGAFA